VPYGPPRVIGVAEPVSVAVDLHGHPGVEAVDFESDLRAIGCEVLVQEEETTRKFSEASVVNLPAGTRVESADSRVLFAPLSAGDIAWYVASGEPSDKAGAYAIQGLASRFVERVEGSYSNVVGLPVALVYRLLVEQGFAARAAD
jgi:predicted house-cleaning NTP pyrophosphatase (Maf/HAM1 superfamily)